MDENTATVVLMIGFFVTICWLLWWSTRTPAWLRELEYEWREHLRAQREMEEQVDEDSSDEDEGGA